MREISLSRGLVALVDDDFGGEGAKWYPIKTRVGPGTHYAQRYVPVGEGGPGRQKMHHAVIGRPPPRMMVDHIDGNGLNNTRANLRFVTNRANQQNQRRSTVKRHSKYPGVTRYVAGNYDRWVAGIRIGGRRKTIGYFASEEAAYAAYMTAVATQEASA